jgi:hypothetical protein
MWRSRRPIGQRELDSTGASRAAESRSSARLQMYRSPAVLVRRWSTQPAGYGASTLPAREHLHRRLATRSSQTRRRGPHVKSSSLLRFCVGMSMTSAAPRRTCGYKASPLCSEQPAKTEHNNNVPKRSMILRPTGSARQLERGSAARMRVVIVGSVFTAVSRFLASTRS